jgi:predicted nucleic acid-binding protein
MVLDASAILELLLATEVGAALQSRILTEDHSLHAPQLADVEVVHVLRRYERAGTIAPQRARMAVDDLTDLRMTRHSHRPLLGRIWGLRGNLTGYDAIYLALAEALGVPLLTRDARLAAAPGHKATVEVL